ncbi:acetyl-CoA carboxylase biotin carboxyl carrier protein [Acaryochloris sp. 'Moss Beach']|uniref:acetyl-CoA carboxylase biotin carboxyl carrier protein n=1 Tax=Acaryochloris sp. 'Moss Beach' TaxID=2740837 RepID=UPI001F41658A|nr:acetyl-CoA carboxylase biotin carboxyl carrier protein [Acaryochloris sp. 'Moss Beach']UJB68132.1 acetyl-CoA carboxylase biotin carboxyl carrier protein [Acaryochloris sp. 'Moss Beach']
MEFDLNQLRELLAILNQTDIDELSLKSNDFELTIHKANQTTATVSSSTAQPMVVDGAALEASIPDSSPPSAPDKKWVDVISPMVGTFYRSPAPDESPFVEVGDTARRGQTICIIEAMKLMNELEAEVNGEIVEILVENGEPIEFGQTLMRINPSS